MSAKNCTTCRFGYQAEEYYSHGRMKWCCMLETGGERQRYALGKARYEPRSCIRWEGEEARLVATVYDKHFGTPEKAAQSMANANEVIKALNDWKDADGALVCALVGRGNGKTQRAANAFRAWLESEADNG